MCMWRSQTGHQQSSTSRVIRLKAVSAGQRYAMVVPSWFFSWSMCHVRTHHNISTSCHVKMILAFRRIILFYVTKGGIQWRMLPTNFPKWPSVYHYLRSWKREGVWVRIHDTLRARVREKEERHKHPTAGCLERQSVKTTEVGGPERGFDTGKQVKGRK